VKYADSTGDRVVGDDPAVQPQVEDVGMVAAVKRALYLV